MKLATLDAIRDCVTPGRHSTKTKGLYLNVSPTGEKAWIARVSINGVKVQNGLGKLADKSFADAEAGLRAILDRKATGAPRAVAVKSEAYGVGQFEVVARAWMDANLPSLKNAEHRDEWRASMETDVFPVIGKKRVPQITPQDIANMQRGIVARAVAFKRAELAKAGKPFIEAEWQFYGHETADRMRQRAQKIIAAYIAAANLNIANPAQKTVVAHLFTIGKRSKKFARMAASGMPEFMVKVRDLTSASAKAGQFLILTCARTHMVRMMQWKHVDLVKAVWTIPGYMMKMGVPHAVPLSAPALAILQSLPQGNPDDFVFVGGRKGSAAQLSKTAIRKCLQQFCGGDFGHFTGHGMRATFRTWAGENKIEERDVLEACLAHAVGEDESERSYNDSDYFLRRIPVMNAWAAYLEAPAAGNVVPLRRAA